MKMDQKIAFAYDASVMFTADETLSYGREPLLRRMPDGSLLAVFFTGGPREPHPDNFVAMIRSFDDGATWTRPEPFFRHPYLCTWATELFQDGEESLCFIHTSDFRSGYCNLRAHITRTRDSGKSWSPPATVAGVPPNFTVRQGKILSDGSRVFPVYWEDVRGNWDFEAKVSDNGPFHAPEWFFTSGVIRSVDQGRTFTLHGAISQERKHHWEPCITELEPGHLRMFIRCESPEAVLWEADSFDYGLTWSKSHPGSIPNPGTKSALLETDGVHLLFNNTCTPADPNRNRLELWISDDNLRSWKRKITLAELHPEPGEKPWSYFFRANAPLPQVSYPGVFADPQRKCVYLAIDSVRKFYLMKIPFSEIL